ncbi:transposase [Sulfuricurvum sp.]|uniref:transposase n=1 Tax=Sulfuricurvum sp. TaxID=2025608 RepID=UPI00356A4ED9
MPRPPRYNETGIYHVINRGVERRNVFIDDADYQKFMSLMADLTDKYGIKIHSFCLMSNHYHILLETLTDNLSEALKHLNVNYSKYFNSVNQRSGHLWQGRFKSFPVFDETQFWTVAKYIERNPIAAGIAAHIENYPYQSYHLMVADNHPFHFLLEESKIVSMGLSDYREFMDTPLQNEWLKSVYKVHRTNKNVSKQVLEHSLASFFEVEGERNDKIRQSYRYGYTHSDIAKYLDISRMTVNKIVNNNSY